MRIKIQVNTGGLDLLANLKFAFVQQMTDHRIVTTDNFTIIGQF